jgi:hypothetical protein
VGRWWWKVCIEAFGRESSVRIARILV